MELMTYQGFSLLIGSHNLCTLSLLDLDFVISVRFVLEYYTVVNIE